MRAQFIEILDHDHCIVYGFALVILSIYKIILSYNGCVYRRRRL